MELFKEYIKTWIPESWKKNSLNFYGAYGYNHQHFNSSEITNHIIFKFTNNLYIINVKQDNNKLFHEEIVYRPDFQSPEQFLEHCEYIILNPQYLIYIMRKYFDNNYLEQIINIIHSKQFIEYSRYNEIYYLENNNVPLYTMNKFKVKTIKFVDQFCNVFWEITFDLNDVDINEEKNKLYHLENILELKIDTIYPELREDPNIILNPDRIPTKNVNE